MRPVNIVSLACFLGLSAAVSCSSGDGPGGGDDALPDCTPTTCAIESATCGQIPDDCGGVLDCGTCGEGQTCGADGPNQCGEGTCTPLTCQNAGASCGDIADGCGQVVSCPDTCGAGEVCGSGDYANRCVSLAVGAGGASGTGGTPPSPPGGLHHSTIDSLPGGETTACELGWTVRMLRPHRNGTVPRRMYFDSCNTGTGTPSMFVSLTVGENAGLEVGEGTTGAIVKATLDPATGQLLPDAASRQFPECVFMHGIATSDDCGTVAALCRRNWGDDDFDMDSLATHNNVDRMTQPLCAPHEMWLYEWKNGDITTEPDKYVVHRAVGTQWDYGNNALVWGDDGTYGMAIKSRVADSSGQCHEADAFLVMNRSDHTFTERGWAWACGVGHTLFNKPGYNSESGKYALLCGTDYNKAQTPRLGALFFRTEDGERNEFLNVNYKMLVLKGGVGYPLPLADGGWLGLIVGVDGEVFGLGTDEEVPLTPPTSIGLVRFDADGASVVDVNWVVQDSDHYLSYPQLAALGDGRFLMGWGTMYDLTNQDEMNDDNFRVPMEYWVQEIDVDGNAITEATLVEGAGWGEQDRMVPLGNGAVAWAYIPDPALEVGGQVPNCNSTGLQLSVYQSSQ